MTDTMSAESRAVLTRIMRKCRQGRLIPFVGAGLTCNVAPALSFNNFVNKLIASHLPFNLPSGSPLLDYFGQDPAKALDFFVWSKGHPACQKNATWEMVHKAGKPSLCRIIASCFNEHKLDVITPQTQRRWTQHLALLRVPTFNTVVTTNWDPCLETACQHLALSGQIPISYERVTSIEGKLKRDLWVPDSPARRRRHIEILKFHGDIHDSESVVATETDYYKRMRDIDDELDEVVYQHGLGRAFLFVGYSITDVNVRYVLHHISHMSMLLAKGRKPRPIKSFMVDLRGERHQRIYSEMAKYIAQKANVEMCHLFAGRPSGGEGEVRKKRQVALTKFFRQLGNA